MKRLIILSLVLACCASCGGRHDASSGGYRAELSDVPGADMSLYASYLGSLEAGDRDAAVEYAELFFDKIDTACVNVNVASLADSLSEYYAERYIYSKAIDYLSRASSIYGIAGQDKSLADARYRLGDMYCMKGQYHLTLSHTVDALDIYKRLGDTLNVLKCYNSLAQIYFICEELDTSSEYLDLYEQGAVALGDTLMMVKVCNNRAVLANAFADSALTRKYIVDCFNLVSSLDDDEVYANVLLNLIPISLEVFSIDDSFTRSLYHELLASEDIVASADDIYLWGNYYYVLGVCHYLLGDNVAAAAELEKSAAIFSESEEGGEFDLNLIDCYRSLSMVYNDLGDVSKAYSALLESDRIDSSSGVRGMYISLFKYENDLLLSQELEAMMERKNQQKLVIMAIVFSALVIVIITLVYFYKRLLRVQAQEASLNNRNDILRLKELQQDQMDELVQNVISKLTRMGGEYEDEALKKEISRICSDLKSAAGNPDNWKEIDYFVPEFNSGFFQRLLKDFPNLSVNERRLCVLLNMNLTTKQIAEITKQTPHSIDIARGRLRSKLGINDRSVSLQAFLSKYNH